MITFHAQYEDQCFWCYEPIHEGDECTYVEDVVHHYRCAKERAREEQDREIADMAKGVNNGQTGTK